MHAASRFKSLLALPVFLLVVTAFAPAVLAGNPYVDKGNEIDVASPYDEAKVQDIGDVFEDRAVYGKLEGETPVDIYSFVASKDGEQSVSLLVQKEEKNDASEPILVLIDPTDATTPQEFNLPLPGDEYHTSLITQLLPSDRAEEAVGTAAEYSYNEPVLMEQYLAVAEQRVTFTKDKKYYLMVLDPGRQVEHYAIRFGTGKTWSAEDFFKHFGSWFQLKTDTYGATTPFNFGPAAVGFFLLLLGLITLMGTWVIQQLFSLSANKSKTAAYLLVKLQPYTTVFTWAGLWFVALGGYMHFARNSWSGLPFIIALLFLPILIISLIDTFILSPQLKQVEVGRKEAVIPVELRKKLFVSFVLNALSQVAFLVFLTMYVVAK